MKTSGIYSRLLLTLVLIGTIFLLISLLIYFIANKQEKLVFETSKVQFNNEVNSLVGLKTASLNQVVYDYTFWDDFVKKIYAKDNYWYENNITSILKSFRFDYVCVYDTSYNLVHEAAADEFGVRGIITKDMLVKLKESRFLDFFLITPIGVVQISAATVHPDTDPTHTLTKPSGFFILAKSWDKSFIDELSLLSSSEIVFFPPNDSTPEKNDFTLSANRPLNSWNGNSIGNFVFNRTTKSLMLFHRLKDSMLFVLVLALLVTGFIFRFAIRRWVVNPLKMVTGILKTYDLAQLAKLQQAPGEFKDIGNLFGDFFKQRDELKRSKEKAEESDKLKTAFLSNLSHEIRTPMNGILGFAELLRTPGLTGTEQEEYIEIIKISGDRMLNIINDIVDISRIEAGLISINNTDSDINKQTAYIFTFFKLQAQGKGLTISCKNGLPANQATIRTDHEKICAILTNLLKNAIKFSFSGSIEFGYILKNPAKAMEPTPLLLEFYVKDTGIGIPADRQKAIFDRFVQADISDIRAFQGAGLGLSISKAYIEMLGGKIWVESTEGEGSTFYFTIPYHPINQLNEVIDISKAAQRIKAQPKQLKILVADDDFTSGMLISLALKDFGKQIIEVSSGADAVNACRQNPDIDLIMMDVKMTGMDGYQATREIRKFNKNVVIIAQTAYALVHEDEKALEAGCTDYISKPLNLDQLKGLVEKYFEK
ncbi:MAG: ATP-binding protein [Bacteroidales bacterium]